MPEGLLGLVVSGRDVCPSCAQRLLSEQHLLSPRQRGLIRQQWATPCVPRSTSFRNLSSGLPLVRISLLSSEFTYEQFAPPRLLHSKQRGPCVVPTAGPVWWGWPSAAPASKGPQPEERDNPERAGP